MKSLSTAALLLAVVLAGCSEPEQGIPLMLPDPANVDGIEVTHWKGCFLWERCEISAEYTIKNRRRIADILAFLEAHNTDYRIDDPRSPSPRNYEYTIHLRDKSEGTVIFLHFGENWFGGAEWPLGCRDRRISATERERLVELFAK